MSYDISKLCADYLRTSYNAQTGHKLKPTHARELVAAFFGYKSHAALLHDKQYPIDKLDEAAILIPDVPLIEHRRIKLHELPQDLPTSMDIAKLLGEYLEEAGYLGGDVWLYESLEGYIEEVLLIDNDNYIADQLSGVMAETNAIFSDYPYYEHSRVTDKSSYVTIEVSGIHEGEQDTERMFHGDTINFLVNVTLDRVAGKRGFRDFEIRSGGSINDDWVDPKLKQGILVSPDSPLALELGITDEELSQLEWETHEISSNDGHPYSYILEFYENSPLEILQKIQNLDGLTVRVSLNAFDEPEDSGF